MKRRKDREMERQIRSILNQAEMEEGDWGRPEEGRKQETLAFLRAQRRKIRLRPRKSFAERLLDQASWLSPGVWLGQLAVPVLFCLLLGNEGLEKRDTLLVLSACAPLPGVIGLIERLLKQPALQEMAGQRLQVDLDIFGTRRRAAGGEQQERSGQNHSNPFFHSCVSPLYYDAMLCVFR